MCLMRGHVYMISALVLGGPLQPPTAWRLCFIGDVEDLVLWKKNQYVLLNALLQLEDCCGLMFHSWIGANNFLPLGHFWGPNVFGAGFVIL